MVDIYTTRPIVFSATQSYCSRLSVGLPSYSSRSANTTGLHNFLGRAVLLYRERGVFSVGGRSPMQIAKECYVTDN